jgi:hypothetical protein
LFLPQQLLPGCQLSLCLLPLGLLACQLQPGSLLQGQRLTFCLGTYGGQSVGLLALSFLLFPLMPGGRCLPSLFQPLGMQPRGFGPLGLPLLRLLPCQERLLFEPGTFLG